jgi:hypothetical protein
VNAVIAAWAPPAAIQLATTHSAVSASGKRALHIRAVFNLSYLRAGPSHPGRTSFASIGMWGAHY